MKKIALLVVGLMASATSVAATNTQELAGGQNDILMTNCNLLANDISIAVSANATGGFACNEDSNVAAISLCHTKGLTIERSSVVTKDESGAATCTVSSTEDCIETVTGAAYPTASTVDGTVVSRYPGASCSATQGKTTAGNNT